MLVDDGRSFVRRSPRALRRHPGVARRHVGGHRRRRLHADREHRSTPSRRSSDYLDHLTDAGMLTITRWVFDGLRLVSLAQEACARARAATPPSGSPSSSTTGSRRSSSRRRRSRAAEVARAAARRPASWGSRCSTRPALPAPATLAPTGVGHWRSGRRHAERLRAPDPRARSPGVLRGLPARRPPDDRRSAVLLPHDEARSDQFEVAFGRTMLFGNGLSALLTLIGISGGARRAVRHRPAGADRPRAARHRLAALARLLRLPRRRLHADRGRAAAAVRAAARPPGVLADGDAVLAAARHRRSAAT